MNKARAMLDALMGPGRDVLEKGPKKEKFKDSTVCKSFLVGFCPLDPGMLGGKRKFEPCPRIHSELMKEQLAAHPDAEKLKKEYEILFLRDLEFAARECDGHIANERQRIREDVRKKKAPLPVDVNARLSAMKREAEALLAQAKSLDDDRLREKESLEARAAEITADREGYMEAESKKAAENVVPEEVCEVCGTAYEGSAERQNHLKFKVHVAYEKIRKTIDELRKSTEETERKKKEARDAELKKKRKEEWEAAAKEVGKNGDDKEGDDKKEKSRDKSTDKRKDRSKDRDRGKERSRDRERDKDKDREKDRDRDKADRREKSKDRTKSEGSKKKDGSRERSKDRRRSADQGRKRSKSRSRSRKGQRGKDRRRSRSRSRGRGRSAG